VAAALIWNLSKVIFISATAGSMKYNAVYGALGVLPLLMFWVYLSWLIVLFGATFAYANQSVHTDALEQSTQKMSQRFREILAVRLMIAAAKAFDEGHPPISAESLSTILQTPSMLIIRVLDLLVAHGLLVEAQAKRGGEEGYIPSRSIHRLSLNEIVEALRVKDGSDFELSRKPAFQTVAQVLQEAEQAGQTQLAKISLQSLVVQSELQVTTSQEQAEEAGGSC
jgi:membrane protein